MSTEKDLHAVAKKIDNFNDDTKLSLKLHVEDEMKRHKQTLPSGLFYGANHEEIEKEVDKKMAVFTKNTDLKPKELYTFLEEELKADPTLSKKQLHLLAYDHLSKTTDSKFLKKIFKKMKRKMK